MTLDPRGPAALIEKATGISPVWAETEKHLRNEQGEPIWTYTPKFLPAGAMQEIAALTDPRVGWEIDVRPQQDNLRIRARRKEHSHE